MQLADILIADIMTLAMKSMLRILLLHKRSGSVLRLLAISLLQNQ